MMIDARILKICPELLPMSSTGCTMHAWCGYTKLAFTKPTEDRLYVKLLKALRLLGEPSGIDAVFGCVPGAVKRGSGQRKRWRGFAILGCCVAGGYVMRLRGNRYVLTEKGKNYLTAIKA